MSVTRFSDDPPTALPSANEGVPEDHGDLALRAKVAIERSESVGMAALVGKKDQIEDSDLRGQIGKLSSG